MTTSWGRGFGDLDLGQRNRLLLHVEAKESAMNGGISAWRSRGKDGARFFLRRGRAILGEETAIQRAISGEGSAWDDLGRSFVYR